MALCPGLPGSASTRKVKPIWILVKQETVSGSGIGWTICNSAPRSRQITTPTPHCSVFYRPDALPAAQPTASKHWRQDEPVPERQNQSGFYWSKRQWVAVASAGPYASLHLSSRQITTPAPHHSVFDNFKNCSHLCAHHWAQLLYTACSSLFWLSSVILWTITIA